ncbi:penicillin-binding protein 2 [Neisseria bacilliformis ATCC BAA-1200]|uniref:Penicillin-binding protein 2 n=1 Tax=Neisseria bacilliformis ATCC BAA-1200 TaxID=888742 RepID=F2BFC2_9NEIS|nr:penicillin-binding protein 2 [Neisseria bacilliformis ATCC BAA-1200]
MRGGAANSAIIAPANRPATRFQTALGSVDNQLAKRILRPKTASAALEIPAMDGIGSHSRLASAVL